MDKPTQRKVKRLLEASRRLRAETRRQLAALNRTVKEIEGRKPQPPSPEQGL
jgi:hypothetical protein